MHCSFDLGEPVAIAAHRRATLISGEFQDVLDQSIGAIYWSLWYDITQGFNTDIAQGLKGVL